MPNKTDIVSNVMKDGAMVDITFCSFILTTHFQRPVFGHIRGNLKMPASDIASVLSQVVCSYTKY